VTHFDIHEDEPAATDASKAVEELFRARPFPTEQSDVLADRYPQLNALDDRAWSHLIAEMGAVQAMAGEGWDFEAVTRLSKVINRLGIGADIHRLVADVIALHAEEDHQ
jgi:hypothetical protein